MAWPTWQQAAIASVVLTIVALVTRRQEQGRWLAVGHFCGETAYVSFLYMLWRLGGSLPLVHQSGSIHRGLEIFHLEQRLHFPSEAAMSRWLVKRRWLAEACDGFYATVHVPALLVFLAWLFIRHRDRYYPWRNALAITTGLCLLIRFWRVTPPRLMPGLGMVDVANALHQSVYGPAGGGVSDQLAAMPSIHCAWAILVGLGVVAVSKSRWRWLILLHPIVTTVVVAATANHWWLDGVVGGLLVVLSLAVDQACRKLAAKVRASRPPGDSVAAEEPQPIATA
jgi:hypothetical protein